MTPTLGTIADVLSILGFVLTVVVYVNVRKIKRGYLFVARVPELIEKLRINAAELVPLQLTFKDSTEQVQLTLGEAEGLLESIRSKVDGSPRAAVVRALKHVRRFPEKATASGLRETYVEIQKCLVVLREHERDLKWERS